MLASIVLSAGPTTKCCSGQTFFQLSSSAATTFCDVRGPLLSRTLPGTANSGKDRGFDILCNQPACSSEAWVSLYFFALSRLFATFFDKSKQPSALSKSLLSPPCHFFTSSNSRPIIL